MWSQGTKLIAQVRKAWTRPNIQIHHKDCFLQSTNEPVGILTSGFDRHFGRFLFLSTPIRWLIHQMPTTAGQAKARNWTPALRLSDGGQRPNPWSHYPFSPELCSTGSWSEQPEARAESGLSAVGCRCPMWCLQNFRAKF